MIAKSDLIILVISSSLLGAAVYRWDQNTRNVDTSTVLANTRVEAPAASSQNGVDSNLLISSTALDSKAQIDSAATAETSALPTIVETVPVENVEAARPFLIHVVRPGDSLSELAARYNTSVQELRDANGINGSTIIIGQEILYPAN